MKPIVPDVILSAVAREADMAIDRIERISGGCIHHTHCLHTASGKLFLKYNRAEEATNFSIEAQGLEMLGRTDTLSVPQVHAYGHADEFTYLLLQWVDQGRQGRDYWNFFGENLARLHQHQQDQFGLDHDNFIGALPQDNTLTPNWETFFIDRRLRPMVELAQTRGYLTRQDVNQFERLYQRIPSLFPAELPALLHGDLWGGNILVGLDGHPVLIDPAVHYGHREMELAFMTLFDRQPPPFYDAYESIYPLASDWRSRIDLCNLYPLLVHVNLFGGGYVASVRNALNRYL